MGQFILPFMGFSFDLILMTRSAALEFSGLDTENKGFEMCGGVKRCWQMSVFGVMIWQIISLHSQCLGLTRFHQQDAQHVCRKQQGDAKRKILKWYEKLLLRVYCKLCVGKLWLKSGIKFSRSHLSVSRVPLGASQKPRATWDTVSRTRFMGGGCWWPAG